MTQTTEGSRPTSMVDETPGPTRDRDHPTFVALAGFFAGLMFVTVVPGGFAGVLRLLFPFETAERLFPIVAVALVVPAVLVAHPRPAGSGSTWSSACWSRPWWWLGVTSLVLYYMVRQQQG